MFQKEKNKLKKAEHKWADRMGEYAGTISFFNINVTVFALWILVNTGVFGENLIFDPYPFILLTMAVSLEAIFLSTFVLINQNRLARITDKKDEEDFVTNRKAEQENIVIMKALERIAKKQDIEVHDLTEEINQIQAGTAKEEDLLQEIEQEIEEK